MKTSCHSKLTTGEETTAPTRLSLKRFTIAYSDEEGKRGLALARSLLGFSRRPGGRVTGPITSRPSRGGLEAERGRPEHLASASGGQSPFPHVLLSLETNHWKCHASANRSTKEEPNHPIRLRAQA